MIDPRPASAQPYLRFVARATPPFTLRPADIEETPRGRDARLQRAAAMAMPTAMAAFERWLAQSAPDAPPPILLVCTIDCELGRQIAEKRLGAGVSAAACGPFVFAVSPLELCAMFAAGGDNIRRELAALDPGDGQIVWAFAVNRADLDLRVMGSADPAAPNPPTPPAPAPSAEATAAGA